MIQTSEQDAGAAATATATAPADVRRACTDCGAPVNGRYCAQCGQATHVHRTLLHLGEELLHGVMHFDGRIWRTLPLLVFRPGRLTREWVEGRRTRYVSPLALFLFTVFVIFFGMSFGGGRLVGGLNTAPLGDRLEQLRLEVEAERAATRASLDALMAAQRASAAGPAGDGEAWASLREREDAARRAFSGAVAAWPTPARSGARWACCSQRDHAPMASSPAAGRPACAMPSTAATSGSASAPRRRAGRC